MSRFKEKTQDEKMSRFKTLTFFAVFIFTAIMMVGCTPSIRLTLSTEDNILTVKPGESVQFQTEIEAKNEEDQNATVTYSIRAGSQYATINTTGLLTVKTDAVVGSSITVVSQAKEIQSNAVTILVGSIPLTGITISANKAEIIKGGNATLSATLDPTNTTEKDIEWVIIEGESSAEVSGNRLIIDEDATDSTVQVKAKRGAILSNTLTFTIAEVGASNLFLSFVNETITLDSKSLTTQPVLEVVVRNGAGAVVTDQTIQFAIEEGAGLVTMAQDGNRASFTILGHGTVKVSALINGTSIEEIATVNVIVPPTQIAGPEKYNALTKAYSYSKIDDLSFEATAVGDDDLYSGGVCEDIVYTFKKGVLEGDDVATYDTVSGEITFNTTGAIQVIATSNSGSRLETSKTFTFDINEGVNVSTFAELKTELESIFTSKVINLVDNMILDDKNVTVLETIQIKVYQGFSSLTINGNSYILDASEVVVPGMVSQHEDIGELIDFDVRTAATNLYKDKNNVLLSEEARNVLPTKTYYLNIYDFNIKGNASVEDKDGCYRYGLRIGRHDYKALYYLEMDNVSAYGFGEAAIKIEHAHNSTVKNVKVGNCYATGIAVNSSFITFKNMYYGICGATGIELSPDSSALSGANFNQPQSVEFAGTIVSDNYNDGDTAYFRSWAGGLVPTIITTNFGKYPGKDNVYQVNEHSNSETNKPVFVFVALIFHEFDETFNKIADNASTVNYANPDEYGIIEIAEMKVFDNEHQYATMTVYAELGGSMITIGKILIYNQNYGKPAPVDPE